MRQQKQHQTRSINPEREKTVSTPQKPVFDIASNQGILPPISGISRVPAKPQFRGLSQELIANAAPIQLQNQVESLPTKPQFRGLSQELIANNTPIQLAGESESKVNKTGLPDNLKAGMENLSGMAMDDVKVHYNSSKPAALNALAYTQGTEIHLAPGKEEHLPHEASHVIQQKQGRVKPTIQAKGVAINQDLTLENEADKMGIKLSNTAPLSSLVSVTNLSINSATAPLQMKHELRCNDGAWLETPVTILDNEFSKTLEEEGLDYGYKLGNDDNFKQASDLQNKAVDGKLFRPNGAEATIEKLEQGKARDQDVIDQYGYVGSQERAVFGRKRIQTYDGGHLIGHQFFGKDADVHGNLAPQHNRFNQLSFRLFEEIVQEGFYNPSKKYSSGAFGEPVEVKVKLSYSPILYSRTLKELYDTEIINEAQYNCLKDDGGWKDSNIITFNSFVPIQWEGNAKSTDPNAKSKQVQRNKEGGYAYNILEDKETVKNAIDVDSDGEFFPASQETFGTIEGMEIDDDTITYGGNKEESFFGIQSVPRDASIQDPAEIEDYYYLNKSSAGKTKSAIIKIIVPNLASDVSMTHLATLDTSKTPTKLEAEDSQFAELVSKIGQKTVCKQLVWRLQNKGIPSKKSEIKKMLTQVAISSVIKPSIQKTKFLSLWLDPKFKL